MAWLPDGEKVLKICLFVLTEYTNVTDRQTHKRTDTANSNTFDLLYLSSLQSLQTQDRYVFLFSDLVIFGKGK